MKKKIFYIIILLLLFGCSVPEDNRTASVPRFGFRSDAQRDGMILKELQKQTKLLEEINIKLSNKEKDNE